MYMWYLKPGFSLGPCRRCKMHPIIIGHLSIHGYSRICFITVMCCFWSTFDQLPLLLFLSAEKQPQQAGFPGCSNVLNTMMCYEF